MADPSTACRRGEWAAARSCRRSWGRRRPALFRHSDDRRCTHRCKSWRPPHQAAGPCRSIRNWAEARARSDDLDFVDFDALIALARRIANALVRLHDLHPGTPQRAGMEIDVAAAAIGHHKTKDL